MNFKFKMALTYIIFLACCFAGIYLYNSINEPSRGNVVSFNFRHGHPWYGYNNYVIDTKDVVLAVHFTDGLPESMKNTENESATNEWSKEKLTNFSNVLTKDVKITAWREEYNIGNVTDQDVWSLQIIFEDGSVFRSSGYGLVPKGFDQFYKALKDYFPSLSQDNNPMFECE